MIGPERFISKIKEEIKKPEATIENEKEKLEEIEKLEKSSQKMEASLSLVDRNLFPENPLSIKVVEKIGKRGRSAPAEHHFNKDKEGKMKNEYYQVSKEFDEKKYNLDHFISIATHEVRHRVQHTLPVELFTKNDIKVLEEEYKIKIKEDFKEYLKKLSPNNLDAVVVENFSSGLFRRGIPLSEISEKIISQDKKKIIENSKILLKKLEKEDLIRSEKLKILGEKGKVSKSKEEKLEILKEIEKEVDEIRDELGMSIDSGIKEAVIVFNAIGLPTSQSCEGHLERPMFGPWVEVGAPNRPEERWLGEKEIFQKIAEKYHLTVEELKEQRYEEKYRYQESCPYIEALKECRKKGETPEYKKWREENKKLQEKTNGLLKEFYKKRKVPSDVRLKIELLGEGNYFRIHNEGKYFKYFKRKLKLSERLKKKLEKKLPRYQKEMEDFANFLKEKYFEE